LDIYINLKTNKSFLIVTIYFQNSSVLPIRPISSIPVIDIHKVQNLSEDLFYHVNNQLIKLIIFISKALPTADDVKKFIAAAKNNDLSSIKAMIAHYDIVDKQDEVRIGCISVWQLVTFSPSQLIKL